MNAAALLLRAIQNKLLLTSKAFEDLDVDEALTARDDLEFEEKWLHLSRQVKAAKFDDAEIKMTDRLREVAFRTTYEHTSDPEISAEVSDDFEVISMGVASGLQDDFLVWLLESYIAGRFPCGPIVSSGTSVDALMEVLRE